MLGLSSHNRFEALAPSRSRSQSRSDVYEPVASRLAGLSLAGINRSRETGTMGWGRETESPRLRRDEALAATRLRSPSRSRHETASSPRGRLQRRITDDLASSNRSGSQSRSRGETLASTRSRSRGASRSNSGCGSQVAYGYEHPGPAYDAYQSTAHAQTPWETVTHKAPQRTRSQSVASSKTNDSSGVASYYSCDGLPPTDPARRIKASEARRQIQQAPPTPPRSRGYAQRGGYPKTFWNREGLPLQTRGPLTEFPVMPSGSWQGGTRPGAARGIYKRAE
ncbi:hypothetical protein Tdes44962_MAKER09160 [Teratosphaeria destructans]|uniref:Uncharacterized protein n=1 Tax=Teratosphaeria destructans TaxID=418781 RepID=A0A9W7SU42_9PEZI|nr:hypothetical protein Tdes44962_MAKER09160 [Teratosphaeria destructans]